MNKEPIGLYIFRFIVGLGVVIFMAMLYWSSVLIEDRLTELKQSVSSIKNDIDRVKDDIAAKIKISELKTPSEKKKNFSSSFPNLLTVDKFYADVLPKMLGPNFAYSGNYRQATIGRPKNLHPFTNWRQVSEWRGLCTTPLGTNHFGIYETLAPAAALRMEERVNEKTKKPEFWLFLRRDVFWQPLKEAFFSGAVSLAPHFLKPHPVTAHDYKFWFDAMMNPFNQEAGAAALRTYYSDVEEVEVIDDYTLVVRWKTKKIDGKEKMRYTARSLTAGMEPLAGFVYKYFANGSKIIEDDSDPETYRKNPLWAQNFAVHFAANVIVSCGAWTFDGWDEKRIRLNRNRAYYNPNQALMAERITKFRENPDSAWQDFKILEVDTVTLRPDQLIEWEEFLKSNLYRRQKEKGLLAKRLDFLVRSYTYIGWNEAKPFFKSKKVRQALSMAIDRKRIIQDLLNGMGVEITGPFFIESDHYDKNIKPYPFDPVRAKLLLEEEGWFDSNGDGIIDKEIDGKRVDFTFYLTYFVKNSTTKAISEFVATSLKEIGIDCKLNGVDLTDLSSMFDDKSFDALLLAWALGTPPEDPKQLWDSAGAKEKGSSNAIGFSNKEADEIIDALEYEDNKQKRAALYHKFHRIIHDEAPYTFLYTPKSAFLYRSYVENVFIPAKRQDLVPGANVEEPQSSIFWLKPHD